MISRLNVEWFLQNPLSGSGLRDPVFFVICKF